MGIKFVLNALAVERVLALPRVAKRALALVVDACLCVLTVWIYFALRLESLGPFGRPFWWASGVSVVLALPLMVHFGLYRAIFRRSGLNAFVGVLSALGAYGLLFACVFTVVGVPGVPRSIGVFQPLLLLAAVGLVRALARFWLSGEYALRLRKSEVPGVLIYGAGVAGWQLASALVRDARLRLVGFLDDDVRLQGHIVDGRRVFAPEQLAGLVVSHGVCDVLLALPSASVAQRADVVRRLQGVPVRVRTVPGVADLLSGRAAIGDLRELALEDLLGREAVRPNGLLLNRNTRGKRVVVTGAGGSIGSELCRQILACEPSCLLLVERDEFALYRIEQELRPRALSTGVELVALLASVCDAERMHEVMGTWQPHTVYHAAAYKHVPLVEQNPAEGIRNNVWGTLTTARAATLHGVANFVLVSTDKAVRPTNVMGASKRLAEMVLQALAGARLSELVDDGVALEGRPVFSMVRFGNVLGSSGSVVPLFRQQIAAGGPVTLTHADITRFFMTIPEAAQLVVQAGAMGAGGDVFVLDMGQPVRIYDLAVRMIELSGHRLRDADQPQGDIAIEITGLRPGEKLYEELLIGNDPQPTAHASIMKAHESCLPWAELKDRLAAMELALAANDVDLIKGLLADLVDGYQPAQDVVDWVFLAHERETMLLAV
ncbi:nucleoside-diphosphate sugar epimerase/dehydratase [Limnohabitans sp.]|uniref:polysaccharide biosynthesis protein n=1 Tax=Limnohabitans sp. TaxID=1907725 RepID=UPI0025C26696|nr:nucleoside-diphosphate sugar epimerase/dehydratase [Limnohabitans sp.]